jgi:hypothetical protein
MATATADLTNVSENHYGEPKVPFTCDPQTPSRDLEGLLRPQIEHLMALPEEQHGNIRIVYQIQIKIVLSSPTTGWAEVSRCRYEIDTTVYPPQPEKEELYSLYSDLYKDLYYHRPRNWADWRDVPIEELQAEVKLLSSRLKAQLNDE